MASLDRAEAVKKLKRQQGALRSLNAVSISSPEFKKWERDTEVALENIFGTESRHCGDFKSVSYLGGLYVGATDADFEQAFHKGTKDADVLLQSMIEEIEEYGLGDQDSSPKTTRQTATTKKVFVVHGRNEAYRQAVARFLEKLKLEPIILHEQANEGRTVIKKFEDHADVAYAVVLLTADDRGGLKSAAPEEQKDRARQNVILELGFFLGRLGRSRVCPLYEEGVELPSDYAGVLFVKLDQGEGWKWKLAKELQSAGLPIDMNDIV